MVHRTEQYLDSLSLEVLREFLGTNLPPLPHRPKELTFLQPLLQMTVIDGFRIASDCNSSDKFPVLKIDVEVLCSGVHMLDSTFSERLIFTLGDIRYASIKLYHKKILISSKTLNKPLIIVNQSTVQSFKHIRPVH